MRLNLAGDIKIGTKQVIQVNLNGRVVWEKFTAVPPEFLVFDGQREGENDVVLVWDIESEEVDLTGLAYQINEDDWVEIEPIEKTGSIETTLPEGMVSHLRMRAINQAGETLSGSISFFVQGDTLVFFEDFEGQPVNEAWKDSFNGNPIAHANTVTVRSGQDFEGRGLQLKYLAFDAGGTYNGSQRMEHPYRHFQIPDHNAYEMSVDWYFENVFDFNTIGQDSSELKRRMMTYGGVSEQQADAQITQWEAAGSPVNPTYAATGFPFITGKMHGLISRHDGTPPAGGQPPSPDEWSVRVSWVKNEASHPQRSGGLYTAGTNPNVGPTLALYIYDQDRTSGDFGRYIYVNDFGGLEKLKWYTIKLLVQVNDPGERNGIAELRVYDKATGSQLAVAYADDLVLRGDVAQNEALIHRLMFSTFYGGGSIRYSAKIDPAWEDLPEIGTNNGTYARNDNYHVNRILALPPLDVQNFQAAPGNGTRIRVSHVHGMDLVEGFEYKREGGAAGDYNDSNWQTVSNVDQAGETAFLSIPNTVGVDYIWVRAIIDGRGSARASVDLTDVNRPPEITFADFQYNRQSEILRINYHVNSYYESDIRFRVNHGGWQVGGNEQAGEISIPIPRNNYVGTVDIDLNAENFYGVSDTESYDFYIPEENVEYYEDFEASQHKTGQPWIDPNHAENGGQVAGGNITVRHGQDFEGKGVQMKYLAFTASGTFPGSQRMEHPFQHFHLPEHKAYELSVDWYFERTWDFNTIAHDAVELKRRLMEYDGMSSAQADTRIAQWGTVNPDYISTGFPFNTGKMHGLISRHDGTPPAGGQPPSPDEWSVRCIWIKDAASHPQMSGGLYTAGTSPNMGPTLAMYIYGQDRVQNEFGLQLPMQNFAGLEKMRWYTVKLFVQVNDPGVANGIAELRVYDKATGALLGSVEATDLRLRGDVSENTGLVHRLMFSTFYGGGDMRWSPKLDPAWEDNGWVDFNNGTHARNDNFIATRHTAIGPVMVESHGYDDGFYAGVSHPLGAHNFDSFETIINGEWISVDIEQIEDGIARLKMPDALIEGYTFAIRGQIYDRNSARSESKTMGVPVLPAQITLGVVSATSTEIQVSYSIASSSSITQRRWRVNGGAWQTFAGVSGTLTHTVTGWPETIQKVFDVEVTNDGGAITESITRTLPGYETQDPAIHDVIVETDRVRIIWYGNAWWDDRLFPPITNARYLLRKRQSNGQWNEILPWTDIDGGYPIDSDTHQELILTGLEEGIEHQIWLDVYNAHGWSDGWSSRTFTPGVGIGVPKTPTIDSITAEDGALIIGGYFEEEEIVLSPPEAPTITQVEEKREELVIHGHPNGDGGSPITSLQYGFDDGEFHGWYNAPGFPINITGMDEVEYTIHVRARNAIGSSPAAQAQGTPLPAPSGGDWPLHTEAISTPLSWTPINEVSMADHAGFAGINAIGSGNPPSSNPNDWVLFKDGHPNENGYALDCLDMVNPFQGLPSRNEFPRFWKVQGGVGALWGAAYDSSAQPTGSLGRAARTKIIGEQWNNSHNQMRRVINKSLPWAGDHRRMNPTLHYDPVNQRYVSFFGERQPGGTWEPDGIRCIGVCWTNTPHERESWVYKEDRPILVHSIVRNLYPELMESQVSGNNYDWARMYPEFSFFYEGKNYFYFNCCIWTKSSTGNDYENIDMIIATTDYTDHTKWERVDEFDWDNIRYKRSDVDPVNPHRDFWDRNGSWHRGLKSMTYYDGYYYAASSGLSGGRGPALYRSTSPFGKWTPYGAGNTPLVVSPYTVGVHNKGNLILYRDVWFLFCSIRDDKRDPNTSPLSTKYNGANVNRGYRVIFGGYYDPLGKINQILNS